ncbi:hypothetical protein [Archaeoglobus sp.]
MEWSSVLKMMKTVEPRTENLDLVIDCARKFHKRAGIEFPDTTEGFVVESGHQPNFLPHAGTFKKAFLLDFLKSRGEFIPLFGIYDYNMATAKWLYKNRIPDVNKNGFKKIGFKLSKKEVWKRFDQVEKPSEKEWEREVEKIKNHYGTKNADVVADEMWKSYELGDSFADVNAILFARLCQHLEIEILFFKYTDIQKRCVFIEEWVEISRDIEKFNQLYNSVVSRKGLEGIGLNDANLAPFWYLCDCGGNVPIYQRGTFLGRCPLCGSNHEFENIEDVFDRLSPRAVFRNLVFAKGLGTSAFVSGSGGGLKYGVISNEMYSEFEIKRPLVLYWKSRDFYLSPVHKKIVSEISKLFGQDIFGIDVMEKRNEWAEKMDGRTKGYYKYSDTLLQIARNAFLLNPSIVDLLGSVDFSEIAERWRKSLENAEIREDEFYAVASDVDFGYSGHYRRIMKLAEESRVADPAGLLR